MKCANCAYNRDGHCTAYDDDEPTEIICYPEIETDCDLDSWEPADGVEDYKEMQSNYENGECIEVDCQVYYPDFACWLNEQLNIESYDISGSGEYLGAEVLMCCGGPDVRLHTRYETVEGHWGGDHCEMRVHSSAIDELDEMLRELYESTRR
jgi:hypothetical protein